MIYRKIVKQGLGAYTITLPKQWIEKNELKVADILEITEINNDLIIRNRNENKNNVKDIKIEIKENNSQGYRSIIGSLYRQGFDVIKIKKSDEINFENLDKAISSIFGIELFIEENEYVIKTIYKEEKTQIKQHIIRIIYSIKNMQNIIEDDLKQGEFKSKVKLKQIRDNILKQRDLILRIIKTQKNNEDNIFPYYNIALSLWGVTRNYYHMYLMLDKEEISKIELLNLVNNYFNLSFDNLSKLNFQNINNKYKKYLKIMKELKENIKESVIASFGISIMQEIQLSDSNISLLNLELN